MSERIGLFGGTFDPVHFGHLRPAIELCEHLSLDVLYLLPNHQPAHRGPTGATSAQRIEMLQQAVADVDQLVVDTREADRGGPTYTVDTLQAMRDERPQANLVFVMGMDSFAAFDRWHRWQDILMLANLVVLDRPGAGLSAFARDLLAGQQARYGSRIVGAEAQADGGAQVGIIECVGVTQLAISATAIRQAAAAGRSLRYLVPESTREYIATQRLYRTTTA